MKNFTKQNFKTNPLWIRLLIMTFMLLAGSGSALAYNQSAVDLYFDNSEAKWSNCYVYIGKSDWTSCYPMKRVEGTQYLWKLAKADFNSGSTWNGATGWVVSMEKWWDNKGESIDKYVWHGDKNVTKKRTSAWSASNIYKTDGTTSVTSDGTTKTVYNTTTISKSDCTVTIESAAGGTLTVEDYDNNEVSNGTSKIVLTVLKFSATPSSGYDLEKIEIKDSNGAVLKTIDAADLANATYTLESAVTIVPTWKQECSPETSITSAILGDDGKINLKGNFNTCIQQWHGFQWRIQGNDWCQENIPNDNSGYVSINTNVNGEDTGIFEPKQRKTYEFRTYIYGDPWTYSTTTIEVSTCTQLPNDAYALSSTSAEWTNSDITPTISKKDENYPTPTITYNGGSALPNKPGEYTIKATVSGDATYCNKEFDLGTFTITCPSIAAPAITTSATVCAGTQVTLSNYNGDNDNTVKWYSDEECNSEVTEQVTLTDNDTKYYAKAYHAASGCYSSEYSTLTFTVNPLPTISISGSEEAVLYEDVTLTATATDGATVKWYEGGVEKATGITYVVTSETATTKTITAKAFLNGCESAAASHPVTFDEEDCNSKTTTVQKPVGKIKVMCKKPSWIGGSEKFYCYAWVNNTSTTLLGGWPGTELTQKEGDYYYVVVDANNKDIRIILNDNSEQTVDSDVLYANNVYKISATSTKSGDKYTFTNNTFTSQGTYTEPVQETVDPEITAPAAKTISVSTTDGEGNIIFSGQVVKTGCDATNEYGFQYSLDEQTWITVKVGENAAAGTVISNNTVTGLDGTYYVRAYITNDNSTKYGAVTEITVSTEKDPITTVTLTHVKNQAGESYSDQELENLTYCVGDIVWFKLEQDGSNFQEYKWISYPGIELKGMYTGGMFQFKITKSGNVGIRLRNDANVDGEGNPTWAESNLLEFNTHPEPTAPTISFAKAIICSNDNVGATLKLGATVSGQAYELWKYANDDDTEGSKVANVATLNCTENNQALQFSGIKTAGKYFVKTYYTAFCNTVTANSSYATLTVVNAKDVSISINPTAATTTPWMPVKLTISATDDYTLEVPEGVEFSQNGDICSVKIPLPQGANGGEGQYENVSFPQDATTSYIVTAKLVSTGGEDNPCAVPATATITLTPYVEECTIGH